MYIDMNSKPALIFGYIVSGSTAASGMATTHTHIVFGLPLSEIALLVGICGTISTIILQTLSYRNTRRALAIQKLKVTLERYNPDDPQSRDSEHKDSVEENKP